MQSTGKYLFVLLILYVGCGFWPSTFSVLCLRVDRQDWELKDEWKRLASFPKKNPKPVREMQGMLEMESDPQKNPMVSFQGIPGGLFPHALLSASKKQTAIFGGSSF